MHRIEFDDEGGAQVDAGFLAAAFRISPDELRKGLRDGTITSRFERGEGEDAGKTRLTFSAADRRVRIVADRSGAILGSSTVRL